MQVSRIVLLFALLVACGSPERDALNPDETARPLDEAEWMLIDAFVIVREIGILTSTDDCVNQIVEHCASICKHRYYERQENHIVYLMDLAKRYDRCRVEGSIQRDDAGKRSGVCRVYQRKA